MEEYAIGRNIDRTFQACFWFGKSYLPIATKRNTEPEAILDCKLNWQEARNTTLYNKPFEIRRTLVDLAGKSSPS